MASGPILKPDQILAGTYRVKKPLSRGAFGSVFLAERASDGFEVVVKALREDASKADPSAAQRFVREAAAAARLDHPNIVRTLNFGQTRDGVLYIVLEWLHGKTLAEAMFEDPLEPEVVKEVELQMLRALDHAHSHNIVHRDIKPSNLFVCQPDHIGVHGDNEGDLVKLLDFGFVKVLEPDNPTFNRAITQHGTVVGTPGYIAPELMQFGEVTPLVDLYGVGVLGYEMLTGQQAFPGEGLERAMKQAKSDPVPPPPHIAGHPLTNAILKLMARQPRKRFKSAREAIDVIEKIEV